MKGLFIPEITAEMFRNGCLESIEALMAEGEICDIDYEPETQWIPVTERLPEPYTQDILVTVDDGGRYIDVLNYDTPGDGTYDVKWYKTDLDGYPIIFNDVVAWMDMKPWKGGVE